MSLILRKASHPNVVDFLKPYLLEDICNTISTDVIAGNIKQAMKNAPDLMYVVVAVDEDDNVHGFFVAVAPPGFSYVFIEQMWTSEYAQKVNMGQKFLSLIKIWAQHLDRGKIRMETARDPRGFTRGAGFKVVSTTMELTLEEYTEIATVSDDGQMTPNESEDSDGIIKRTEDGVGVVGVPETAGPEAGAVHKGEVTQHSGTVHGTGDRSADVAVPISTQPDQQLQPESIQVRDESGRVVRVERDSLDS